MFAKSFSISASYIATSFIEVFRFKDTTEENDEIDNQSDCSVRFERFNGSPNQRTQIVAIQACDFQHLAYKFRNVDEFEVDSCREEPTTASTQMRSQAPSGLSTPFRRSLLFLLEPAAVS
jgi:hypothetical protein